MARPRVLRWWGKSQLQGAQTTTKDDVMTWSKSAPIVGHEHEVAVKRARSPTPRPHTG